MTTAPDLNERSVPKPMPPLYDTPEFYAAKLEEALGLARGEPLAFSTLLERLRTIWQDEDRQLVLERLERLTTPVQAPSHDWPASLFPDPGQRPLPDGQWQELAEVLRELVHRADALPARDRDRADRAVSRMTRLIPIKVAWSIVGPWFRDHRAFRRAVAVRVLLERGVPPEFVTDVVAGWRETQNRRLLTLIGRNPHVAALVREEDVAEALAAPEREWVFPAIQTPQGQFGPVVHRDSDARYWKMRAIEVLLIGGHVPSDAIAFGRPMEFVWAVGRQRHRTSLPLVRRVLDRHESDPEFVWRCMRALDRIGEPADVDRIRRLATAIVGSRAETRAA